MSISPQTRKLSECADHHAQKAMMMDMIGDLSGFRIMNNLVLVGIYIEPSRTKGGLILTDNRTGESVWQGTVGLALKKGPASFRDEPASGTFFYDQDVAIGEWVAFRPGDARRVQINGVDCRMVQDSLLDAVVDDPNIVTHR